MLDKDTKLKIDSLDRRLEKVRSSAIELKSDMKTLYSELGLSQRKINTLESKYGMLVERILDVDSVFNKHTRQTRQMLTELMYEMSANYELDNRA